VNCSTVTDWKCLVTTPTDTCSGVACLGEVRVGRRCST
jgi:hypothetical protein